MKNESVEDTKEQTKSDSIEGIKDVEERATELIKEASARKAEEIRKAQQSAEKIVREASQKSLESKDSALEKQGEDLDKARKARLIEAQAIAENARVKALGKEARKKIADKVAELIIVG